MTGRIKLSAAELSVLDLTRLEPGSRCLCGDAECEDCQEESAVDLRNGTVAATDESRRVLVDVIGNAQMADGVPVPGWHAAMKSVQRKFAKAVQP